MRFSHKVHNKYKDIEEFIRKHAYLMFPLLGTAIYFICNKLLELNIDTEFNSNIINVSAVLAGFLFSSLGIIISLPQNRFIERLKLIGYMEIIYRAMFLGIIFLISTLILGLFNIGYNLKILLFVSGLSETILSSYYLYKVTKLSSKSK
ncbi:hypothetical protein [Wansuia hejianensis]|uniref:Uncharacterized protein n=1 Tax=Wansuia hejianensis TaxID=2763667 RepID=A0A926IMP3_9FIRM|nr:hypothetical protein [Wansuia hejianensis]MBC8590655.1 hypothetical protein [Wansuia hejianensis]